VDILNILGISMMLMGVLCWLTAAPATNVARWRGVISAVSVAAAIALLTPLLWTTWRPRFLPWPLETYFDGIHTYDQPQHWLFPIFPWCAFAFVGLAVGFLALGDFARHRESAFFAYIGVAGIIAILISIFLDVLPIRVYAVYDYWHSNPNFFFARCGVLLIILWAVYAWCKWGIAQRGFSPVIQLGRTSLLIYWVHIEFVYGRFSILPKHRTSIPLATLGLLTIFVAMLGLSIWRTRYKGKTVKALRRQAPAAPEPAT
jgi:fucose 4-O-acetylase-like acetyltransferase